MARRRANLEDVRASIDATLYRLAKEKGGLTIPIDLAAICRIVGVDYEFRWMIPEGVTGVVDDKLKIFIRNNFPEEQVSEKRQRFTWAHEICHALLYDLFSTPPKPAQDTPKGAQLESLCQNGAGYLLMPATEIKRIFNLSRPVASIDDVVELSNQFAASYEVVIRRLKQESACLRTDYALVLTRNNNGVDEVLSAAHDIWLKTFLQEPVRGQAFEDWAKPFLSQAMQTGPNEWEKSGVKMGLKRVSRYSMIVEIKQA